MCLIKLVVEVEEPSKERSEVHQILRRTLLYTSLGAAIRGFPGAGLQVRRESRIRVHVGPSLNGGQLTLWLSPLNSHWVPRPWIYRRVSARESRSQLASRNNVTAPFGEFDGARSVDDSEAKKKKLKNEHCWIFKGAWGVRETGTRYDRVAQCDLARLSTVEPDELMNQKKNYTNVVTGLLELFERKKKQ